MSLTASWPGAERRYPGISSAGYLHLHELTRSIRAALRRHYAGRADLTVLDVACARKPYYPFFAPHTRRYVGLDPRLKPGSPDCLGLAEAIPFRDGAFDLVLCTQAFSYFVDPWRAAGEFARVLKPSGRLFLSTPGLFPYMEDRWRFTQDGLERLLRAGGFDTVDVYAQGGAVMCLGQLLATYAAVLAPDAGRSAALLQKVAVGALNAASRAVDGALQARGATFATMNYFVVATKEPT